MVAAKIAFEIIGLSFFESYIVHVGVFKSAANNNFSIPVFFNVIQNECCIIIELRRPAKDFFTIA